MMTEEGGLRLCCGARTRYLLAVGCIVAIALIVGANVWHSAAASREGAMPLNAVAPEAEAYFEIHTPVLHPGERLYVTVRMDVRDMVAFAYRISFDPDLLQVVDADPNRPGNQIAGPTGAPFALWQEPVNNADNVLGQIRHEMSRVGDQRVTLAGGKLSLITFEAQALEESTLSFVAQESRVWKYDPYAVDRMRIIETTWNPAQIAFGNAYRVELPLVLRTEAR